MYAESEEKKEGGYILIISKYQRRDKEVAEISYSKRIFYVPIQ